jgi:dienelactone hydrolase
MRPFEIILLLAVTILPFIKRKLIFRINPNYLLLLLAGVFGLHILLEGYRWQMFPAYLLMLLFFWRIKTIDITKPVRLTSLRVIGFIGMIIIALLGWIWPMTLPVFSLPEPRGGYNVGTESIYVQTDREEIITKDSNDKRELVYKVWYPSEEDISSLKGEKYVDKASRSGFATKYGLPAAMLNYLDLIKTYAYPKLFPADGVFPVLIFSHGYGSKATGYYGLLTELASQGYIIVNMNHTFESLGVTFPDGRIKYFDYDFQREVSSEGMKVMEPLIEAFKKDLDFEQRHPIVRKAVNDFYESKSEDRWAEDMIHTIDLLKEWNLQGFLKDKIDLNKIGIFGHSNGGGSAGKVAQKDNRVKAAANIDGITWGNLIDTVYHIPFLYISADWPAGHEDINSHIYINKSTDYFYETKLLNSGHPNFMDIPFMIPVQLIAGTGDIDPYLGTEIVTKLLTVFFDRHLKKASDISLESISEQYELLEMKVHRGDSIKRAGNE